MQQAQVNENDVQMILNHCRNVQKNAIGLVVFDPQKQDCIIYEELVRRGEMMKSSGGGYTLNWKG